MAAPPAQALPLAFLPVVSPAAMADALGGAVAESVAGAVVEAAGDAVADAMPDGECCLMQGITPVYFGNGCFWGRQFDFVNTEKALGRSAGDMSAVVGYAGGRVPSAAGKVCYYRGPAGSVYEELGHAEVVKVDLRGDMEAAKQQYAMFAQTYFKQFRKTPFGMMRLDPQDAGPGYRNVIGLPGGVDSPFFPILQVANVNGMQLLPGSGNFYDSNGQPAEDDEFNTVWVLDSNRLAFNQAEVYHQLHNGIGKAFPKEYTKDLKQAMMESGKIDKTRCPDYYFF
ncbi:expressed protein [Chlorella variabilis]|uniref:peptide-methionine (S)-S-oxide reductase n=1 Tax=Chlorella variabilis TaxID=554065 RepID=E1ZSU3_CHLVA|nr:expressed protein [Chlorella variabilis]EFN51097.1 expressed protein [Chlorella variabilis]|eukprot:XP_005843199.1 expressed protein [Chlorella variabilis]